MRRSKIKSFLSLFAVLFLISNIVFSITHSFETNESELVGIYTTYSIKKAKKGNLHEVIVVDSNFKPHSFHIKNVSRLKGATISRGTMLGLKLMKDSKGQYSAEEVLNQNF